MIPKAAIHNGNIAIHPQLTNERHPLGSLQGAMLTGWMIREGKTYFLDADGVMATGWYQIDGNWYYFWPDSSEMAKNQYINGFYVNEDGIWYR